MSTDVDIDILPTIRQTSLLDIMRAGLNLPIAAMRHGRMDRRAHRELIKLVQRLFLNVPQTAQAVVFSAVEPGSGCSFVCTRTAEILANQLEEPVCLVDANFRSAGLKQQFEFEHEFAAPQHEEWTFMPDGTNY